jgi:transposase InsO family protein
MHSCIKSRWVAEKMLWVTAYQEGKPITQIANSAKVSRHTIYKWLGRFEETGINGLMPRRPGCKTGTHPKALSSQIVTTIITLFDEDDYGIRSIVHELHKKGISVSHMSVYRYLVARGKIVPLHKRRRKTPNLHVCDIPGEELQLDVMHVDPIPGTEEGRTRKGFHYQYTIVDDCTRVQYAKLFPQLSQDNTCLFLEEVLSKSPFQLQKVRMDNGAEFQTKTRSFLKHRRINFIYNPPSRPDYNGKVERTHRIDYEEFYLKNFSKTLEERQLGLIHYLHRFNNHRPHWGLGMDGKTPLEKLQSFPQYKSVNLIV